MPMAHGKCSTVLSCSFLLQIKQKQKGSKRILMPSVQGQQAGKWVVIDSGNTDNSMHVSGSIKMLSFVFTSD
jgi:hypothetical protein